MKTSEILKLNQRELQNLTDRELRQAVSTLRSTSRKRYERLTETDVYSPSQNALLKGAEGRTAIFTPIKDLDETQLINEFKRYKGFLQSQTSTVTGARKANKDIREKTEHAMMERGETVPDDFEWLRYYHLVDVAQKLQVAGAFHYKVVKEVVYEVYSRNVNANETDLMQEIKQRLDKQNERENQPTAIYPSRLM